METGGRTWQAVAIVVCGLLFASVTSVVVTAQDDGPLRFADSVTTEQRGDVAHVPIRVGDRRHVVLSVRAPDGTYDTRVRIVDDGAVLGRERGVIAAESAGE